MLYLKVVYNIVCKYLIVVSIVEKKSLYVLWYFFVIYFFDNGVDLNVIKVFFGYVNLVVI